MNSINWPLIGVLIAGGSLLHGGLWLAGVVKLPEAWHTVVWGSAGIVTYACLASHREHAQRRVSDYLAMELGRKVVQLREVKSELEQSRVFAQGGTDGR